MLTEFDQSGKVEETGQNTTIAFSDGIERSILITAREKRKLQKVFRKLGKGRMFVYQTFVVLIFLLVRNYIHKVDRITIDTEYPGHNELLRRLLWEKIRLIRPDFDLQMIEFKQVGKKSPAHALAYRVQTHKQQPDIKVTAKDVMRVITK